MELGQGAMQIVQDRPRSQTAFRVWRWYADASYVGLQSLRHDLRELWVPLHRLSFGHSAVSNFFPDRALKLDIALMCSLDGEKVLLGRFAF